MRTASVTAAAALVLIVAGCTSSEDSSGLAEPAVSIEYPAGPNDVLIQVGDYDFGWPDGFLVGP